jgi:2-polyprenyl-3-methyl-5-hydroxy-6-metoxy-1,4-benzoquinol methylase
MDDPAQACAYAAADFSEPHTHFIDLFRARFGEQLDTTVLDLGCGPGDICRRFARAWPACRIHAVDASAPMLALGRQADQQAGLQQRIEYFERRLPQHALPQARYSTIISNSLLHHLPTADILWHSLKQLAAPGCRVFIMDLLRPDSPQAARQLVNRYAGEEAPVLQQDFYHSLLAAYRPEEILEQLLQQGLDQLKLEVVSDRHQIVHGYL